MARIRKRSMQRGRSVPKPRARHGIFTDDKHAWTDEERYILWLLRTNTDLCIAEQDVIINHIFGLNITPKVLRNQRMDGCRRIGFRSARWVKITTTPIAEPEQQARLRAIVGAAQELGIHVSVDGLEASDVTNASQQLERIARLEMVHWVDLQWGEEIDEQPFWDAAEEREINAESEIYKHGGMVCRVRTDAVDEVDFMICDPRICTCSNRSSKKAQLEVQPGHPRVHASDLLREGTMMVFNPCQVRHQESFAEGFERTVYFDIGDQLFPVRATICDFPNCKICSAPKRRHEVKKASKARVRFRAGVKKGSEGKSSNPCLIEPKVPWVEEELAEHST